MHQPTNPIHIVLQLLGLGLAVFFCSILLPACPAPSPSDASSSENQTTRPNLIEAKSWALTPQDQDPYKSRRPDKIICPPEVGYGFEVFNEEPSFQVKTGECNYLTVQQPLQRPLFKGDKLHLRLWYFSLSSFEANEAFVSIRFGETTIWSKTLPLPARSNLEFPTLELTQDFPAQTTLFFHVDNHGANTWHLIELSASRP